MAEEPTIADHIEEAFDELEHLIETGQVCPDCLEEECECYKTFGD